MRADAFHVPDVWIRWNMMFVLSILSRKTDMKLTEEERKRIG
ncbi:MAG: hypothetical protein ACLRPV_15775 [Lacrimispora saccharolytica]